MDDNSGFAEVGLLHAGTTRAHTYYLFVAAGLARELYAMMRSGEYGYSIVPNSTSGDWKGRP